MCPALVSVTRPSRCIIRWKHCLGTANEERPQLVPEVASEHEKAGEEHQVPAEVPHHRVRIETGEMVVQVRSEPPEQERRRAKGLPDEIYDVTAWSLPILMGVEVVEAAEPPDGARRRTGDRRRLRRL